MTRTKIPVIYTAPEAAQLACVSPSWLKHLWRKGEIEAVATTSKGWPLFERHEIEHLRQILAERPPCPIALRRRTAA